MSREPSDAKARPPERPNLKQRLLQFAVIGLFIVAIVYFLRRYSDDISSLRNLTPTSIAALLSLSLVSYSAYALAVFSAFAALGLKGLSRLEWLKIYFVSRLVNLFVVQGGNIYRLLILKRKYSFPYTNTVAVTGLLIWLNALLALAVTLFAIATSATFGDAFGPLLNGVLIAAFLLLLIAPLMMGRIAEWVDSQKAGKLFLVRNAVEVARYIRRSIGNSALFFGLLALSLVHYLVFLLINDYTFTAVGHAVDWREASVFTTAFVFTRYINIVPGNLGLSELVGGLVSELLGTGFGYGLVVTGVIRIVEVLMIVLVGSLYRPLVSAMTGDDA